MKCLEREKLISRIHHPPLKFKLEIGFLFLKYQQNNLATSLFAFF
jgi:hypothetical protein